MGVLEGKVAFISGGGRGQGRSHAVRLAEEGADIIVFDICAPLDTIVYAQTTEDDLAETVRLVESLDRRIVARKADARDQDAVQRVLDEGVAELGRVDIVLASAGIMPIIGEQGQRRQAWHDCIDVMLTGVLHTCEAAIPRMIEQGEGGSIIITSSVAGLKGPIPSMGMKSDGMLGYIAAKHGVVGLMRSYASCLGPHQIRCNSIHPTGVKTGMVLNPEFLAMLEEMPEFGQALTNVLPVSMVDPVDISNAIVYLASEAGRYVSGVTLPVDGGLMVR